MRSLSSFPSYMHFNRKYLLGAVLIFFVEVIIALYVRDDIIRPYGGDFLVVILIYCFVRAFTKLSAIETSISVLIFSFLIEVLQLIGIVDILGLRGVRIAEIVIGTGFSWLDLLAYTLGILFIYFIDR